MTNTKILVVMILLLLFVPERAHAAPPGRASDQGLLLRAGGDVRVGADERASAVVVLGGNAEVRGHADALLVVGGDALLEGADVGDVTVVGGRALLRQGTRVAGNLRLVGSELERDPSVAVAGAITRESSPRWGFFPFGLLFALGASAAVVLAGILALVLAPRGMERSAEFLRRTPGRTLLSAAAVFFLAPPLAVLCMLTIVGIPIGAGALVFVLPALAFLGYLVAGYALGRWLLEVARTEGARREASFLAMVIGLLVLMLLGALPVAGAVVGLVATFLGAGAIALLAWRTLRERRRDQPVEPPAQTLPLASSGQPAHS